jgi:hypothetical protein
MSVVVTEVQPGKVLRCACCGLPYARLVDGKVVIVSRHHGEAHANAVSLAELEKLCQEGAPK